MFNEKDKAIIHLVAAAISSGSSVDEAFEVADEVIARLLKKDGSGKAELTWDEIAQGNPNPEYRFTITPEYLSTFDSEGNREIYRYDVRRVDGLSGGSYGAARMTPAQGNVLLVLCERETADVDMIITRAYPGSTAVTDQMVYSVIRGLKRHFSDMGVENAIQNSRKFGFYLNPNVRIDVLPEFGIGNPTNKGDTRAVEG